VKCPRHGAGREKQMAEILHHIAESLNHISPEMKDGLIFICAPVALVQFALMIFDNGK
jgi:hypothetical protein